MFSKVVNSGVARGVHVGSYAPSPYTGAPSIATVMFTELMYL